MALVSHPTSAPWWIHEWIARAPLGSGFTVALDTLTVVLCGERLSYEERADLYSCAKEAQLEHVAFLFRDQPPSSEAFDPERPLDPYGRPLTLGERKTLARGTRREILEKLVRDPHPDVVELLLANPRVTEREVLRITTRRPVSAQTLVRVVLNERYRPRPAIRKSLCMNPYLPVPVAARLMTTLPDRDLRLVCGELKLSAQLRLHARSLLELRHDAL